MISQFGVVGSLTIRCDNQSAIMVAKNDGYNPRTKHIDIRHHFIRDAVDKGLVALEYVTSEDQIADGLTKPLPRIKLEKNRTAIGVIAKEECSKR